MKAAPAAGEFVLRQSRLNVRGGRVSLTKSVFPLLPRRKESDKSHFGHVLIVAGSRAMSGAGILAARAALVSGSGLVTLGVPRSIEDSVSRRLPPEIMLLGLPETPAGTLSERAYPSILSFLDRRKISAMGLGPGLSLQLSTQRLIRRLVRTSPVPLVLDADGLNSFRGKSPLFRHHRSQLVLTPHRKEFERLYSKKLPEDRSDRAALAKKLSRIYDEVLVLKGHRSWVVYRDRIYENTTGNAGMAKGGSGDVLTGIIASFIGQGLSVFEAAVWAVYFHGRAGDITVRKKSQLGLLASDLIEYLPAAFRRR